MPRMPAPWLIQGTAVHAAIEVWEDSFRQAPEDAVLAAYEESWEAEESKAWEREPDPAGWQRSGMKKVETDLSDRRIRGRDQVLTYMEETVKETLVPWILPDTGWVATEVSFEEDFGGVLVKGFIDLILQDKNTKAFLVRDIKTGTKKPVGNFQLKTYSIAMRRKYGIDIEWGDYWMCKDGAPTAPEFLGGVPEEAVIAQYQILAEMDEGEMYGANIGEHCARCDVAKHCPFVGGEPPKGIAFLGT